MAITTHDKELSVASHVSMKDLDDLWEAMRPKGGRTKVTFDLSDETSIESEDLETVRKFPNSKSREISRITLSNGIDAPTSVSMSIGQPGTGGSFYIRYRISGQDADVLFKSQKIGELARNCAMWYGFLQSENSRSNALLLAVLALVNSVTNLYFETQRIEKAGIEHYAFSDVPLLVKVPSFLAALLIVFAFFPRKVLRYAFPASSFGIGAGVARFERATYIRRALITLIVITIPLSLVMHFLVK